MDRNVMNVYGIGQQPEQNIAYGPIAKLGQDGTGTGHLQLLKKKPCAPGKTK
jgi:hypothetical protein